jgi:hypothetical protein
MRNPSCEIVENAFSVLRSLPLDEFRAEHGLLASLSGFNRKTLEEARWSFFKVRLWDADTFLDAERKNDLVIDGHSTGATVEVACRGYSTA